MTDRLQAPSTYETSDVSIRLIGWSGLALVASLVLSAGAVAALLARVDSGTPPVRQPLAVKTEAPPAPRLETHPVADRLAREAVARKQLSGYGWRDRANGLARIPIERAMRLQAERGWPEPERKP